MNEHRTASELVGLYALLYLDQDVPVQLAAMLRARGIDAVTTLEVGALGQPDPEQLAFAVSAFSGGRRGEEHFGIVLLQQRRELGTMRDRLLELLDRFDREQFRNQLFYL